MNEIIKYNQNADLAILQSEKQDNIFVFYEGVDASHYSFSYKYGDNISVNMTESDRRSATSEFVNAEFDEELNESDKICYLAAAVSGLLIGILKESGFTDAFEETIEKLKISKEWQKYVVRLAVSLGYMKSDYAGAVKYIANMAIQLAGDDVIDSAKEQAMKCLKKASAHPTVVGLVFSVTSQFTGKNYEFKNNQIDITGLPEYYAIGRNYHEKVTYGLLYWVFDLAVDVVYAKRNILDNLNIPSHLITLIKAFVNSNLMRDVPYNYEESIRLYSQWIKKLFENSSILDENGEELNFDLEESINISMKGFFRETMPIVMNECFVRGFYFVHKLTTEIEKNSIGSISELSRIKPENILPFNNRVVSRMCLISSASYMGVNGARVLIEYLKGKKVGDRNFKDVLLETLDISGVGRLCIAVAMDAGYWKEDFSAFYERIRGSKEPNASGADREPDVDDARIDVDKEIFEKLTLDPLQARILYSFESIAIEKDIERTKDSNSKALKEEWYDLWKDRITMGQAQDKSNYFVQDEDLLYDGLFELSKDKSNLTWLYLMGTEMVLFEPYRPLGVSKDKEFVKLKSEYDYVKDQFIRRQTVVSQAEVDNFLEKYKKFYGTISGNTAKLAMKIGLTAAGLAAGGGLALAFAPSIAVLLAGEAVAGLHGAALTSASLAFIGGGSLAAGGLGMAGGTAIIAGGGAVLGLASSAGTVSIASMLNQMDESTIVKMAAKLAAFCDVILNDTLKDKESINRLRSALDSVLLESKKEFEILQKEDNDLDKDILDRIKNYIKYMTKLKDIMKDI